MSLASGDRVGPFEIVALIGEGGMGQVYRARDPKLARDVAIKVLPEAFARDAERIARFRREAQALAALNDPRIAQIYHLEETGDRAALVMEFVEGQTLAEMIHGRPLDLEDVLRYAGEIAAGLETAHEKGIVHRDLKPANVKITPDGHAKILDFGLAKAMAPDPASTELMNSPTLTARATEAGMILGTAAYMSPEQARGKSVDKRTDIWAFGALLFEMLTGRRAFDGETVSDTLASVLRSDPEWSAIPASVPAHVHALMGRCLERDASRRLRDIGEARLALAGEARLALAGEARLALTGAASPVASGLHSSPSMIAAATTPAGRARPWPWIAATAVLAVALAALVPTSSLIRPGASAAPTDSYELAIAAPAGAEFAIGSNSGNVTLSPDGSRIAFVAATDKAATLWVRSLAADDARSIPGTEGASNPFWSPDGRHIGFFASGKLRTVDVAGGLPENIADAPLGRGGAWSDDGTIIFTGMGGAPLSRVAATGGAVTPLTKFDEARGENAHYWPVFLPGGSKFLYFARSTQVENSGIYLGHMDGSPAVRVVGSLSSGIVARHAVSGGWYLLWVRDTNLLAQPFDLASGRLSGEATPIAQGVRVEESQRLAYASASLNGHLAWATSRAADSVLAVYSRDGRRLRTLDVPPGQLAQPAFSPDGSRLLFIRIERGGSDIFMHDLKTGVTERLTTAPDFDELPVWTPDGRAMTYLGRDEELRVTAHLPIGTGAKPITRVKGVYATGLESPDGRYIIYTKSHPNTGNDIMAQPLQGGAAPVTLLQGPGEDVARAQSADGRTIVIVQTVGGRSFVAVARLRMDGATPVLGPAQTVAEGTERFALRPDGREIFAWMPDGTLKVTALAPAGETLAIGATTVVGRWPAGTQEGTVNTSGTEFVVSEYPFAVGQTLRVLTRWDARLRK